MSSIPIEVVDRILASPQASILELSLATCLALCECVRCQLDLGRVDVARVWFAQLTMDLLELL